MNKPTKAEMAMRRVVEATDHVKAKQIKLTRAEVSLRRAQESLAYAEASVPLARGKVETATTNLELARQGLKDAEAELARQTIETDLIIDPPEDRLPGT